MTTVHKKSLLARMSALPNTEKKNENEKRLNSARVEDELTKNFLICISVCRWDSEPIRPVEQNTKITFYRKHVYTQELREMVISREIVIHFSHTKYDFQYGSDSSKVTICPLPRQKCFSWRGDHWGRMGQAMEKPHVVHYELRHSNSTTDITTEERRPKEKSANIKWTPCNCKYRWIFI